jgi:hypothetical protein
MKLALLLIQVSLLMAVSAKACKFIAASGGDLGKKELRRTLALEETLLPGINGTLPQCTWSQDQSQVLIDDLTDFATFPGTGFGLDSTTYQGMGEISGLTNFMGSTNGLALQAEAKHYVVWHEMNHCYLYQAGESQCTYNNALVDGEDPVGFRSTAYLFEKSNPEPQEMLFDMSLITPDDSATPRDFAADIEGMTSFACGLFHPENPLRQCLAFSDTGATRELGEQTIVRSFFVFLVPDNPLEEAFVLLDRRYIAEPDPALDDHDVYFMYNSRIHNGYEYLGTLWDLVGFAHFDDLEGGVKNHFLWFNKSITSFGEQQTKVKRTNLYKLSIAELANDPQLGQTAAEPALLTVIGDIPLPQITGARLKDKYDEKIAVAIADGETAENARAQAEAFIDEKVKYFGDLAPTIKRFIMDSKNIANSETLAQEILDTDTGTESIKSFVDASGMPTDRSNDLYGVIGTSFDLIGYTYETTVDGVTETRKKYSAAVQRYNSIIEFYLDWEQVIYEGFPAAGELLAYSDLLYRVFEIEPLNQMEALTYDRDLQANGFGLQNPGSEAQRRDRILYSTEAIMDPATLQLMPAPLIELDCTF